MAPARGCDVKMSITRPFGCFFASSVNMCSCSGVSDSKSDCFRLEAVSLSVDVACMRTVVTTDAMSRAVSAAAADLAAIT